jgi:4-hydroxybenzoate polyprenyltransferase
MEDTPKKDIVSDSGTSFVIDFFKVSRPGWWIVTAWLYVAPAKSLDFPFWPGLLYACLPLNVIVYGLNDYADVEVDVANTRKGNLIFGPKGMQRPRLRKLLEAAILCTLIPLLMWSFIRQEITQYLVWYALVILVNCAYNLNSFGHCSENGPFEVPVVFFGFSLVTVLSYWLNGNGKNDPWGYQPASDSDDSTTMKLFGCNYRYWIHLWFLVCRTQLWTEYMDYESDRAHKRGTTLAKLPSKNLARLVVLAVLIAEATWNWLQYEMVDEWQTLFLFSLLGVGSFIGMDFAPLKSSSFMWVALVQSAGGLWLIQDCWQKQVFVS